MRKPWVKNVYKQRIQLGKTGARLSPTHLLDRLNKQFSVHNPASIPQLTTSFLTYLFTPKMTKIPLLLPSYTHNPQDLIIEERKEN